MSGFRISFCTILAILAAAIAFPAGLHAEAHSGQSPDAELRPGHGDVIEEAEPGIPVVLYAEPANVRARDLPNDAGHGILVTWDLSPDDSRILAYDIYRVPEPGSPPEDWVPVGTVPRGIGRYDYVAEEPIIGRAPNPAYIPMGASIEVAVRARDVDGALSPFSPTVSAVARGDWFHTGKVNILVVLLVFGLAVVYFIREARKGRELYVRPIPGIDAVDEAIGRATEMGRPILFVLGTGTAGDIATIAGYTVLARVARRTAEYQTQILVPVNDPVMMAMAQETVREAYMAAGRPEVFRQEDIFYISAMQFPYVAAVNGVMMRERTATNFYMGVFHAEALILAEAGSVTGAIQISGTDQVSQIPFFVAATDYTLIGEELYAASAYLSQDPIQLGPLKAQDYTKLAIVVFVLLAVLLWSIFGSTFLVRLVHAV